MRNMGLIFCRVLRMRQFIQEAPCIDWGSQKCRGGIPIFMTSPDSIIIVGKFTEARDG